MDEYIDKIAVPQVKEILTNYGHVPPCCGGTRRRHEPGARRKLVHAV